LQTNRWKKDSEGAVNMTFRRMLPKWLPVALAVFTGGAVMGQRAFLTPQAPPDISTLAVTPTTLEIGDTVWLDVNANGVQDAGEPGIPGVTLRLYLRGSNGYFLRRTTTTDANGNYWFDRNPSLPPLSAPGDYRVILDASTLPAGLTQTYDHDGLTTPHQSDVNGARTGNAYYDEDFGYTGAGSIGDYVWNDLNGDTVQDANEPPIEGVKVTVTWAGFDGQLGTGDDIVYPSVTTNAAGIYTVGNLPAGSFRVTVDASTVPAGFVQTYDLDGLATPNRADTTLTFGQHRSDVDYGYRLAAASLGDFVWEDLNFNGVQDMGEPPVAGVVVNLTGPSGPKTTTTDANGWYQFTNLAPGQYNVTFVQPAGYAFTTPDAGGDDAKDSDANPGTGAAPAVTLAAGESNQTIDAGVYRPAKLGDYVWEDRNNNGVQDAGEPGVPGVTVTLDGPGGPKTTVTDTDGKYEFTNLVPGTYTVTFTKPDGYVFSNPNQGTPDKDSNPDTTTGVAPPVTLPSDGSDVTIDAGLVPLAKLGDFVWHDLNANGKQDAGEAGIPNVKVTVAGPNGYSNETTTDGTGYYEFKNLLPGEYTVTFTKPADYVFTTANVGTDDKDSDADATTGAAAAVTLAPGESNTTIDAGLYKTVCLGDTVWYDLDGNGAQNGEPGVPNVTLKLYDADGNLLDTTATGGDGTYKFCGLKPGTYTVVVVNPPANHTPTYDVDSIATPNKSTVEVTSGQDRWDVDFGYKPNPASLGDFVWHDLDADGIQDANEPGIPGVTVTLDGPGGIRTTTTGPNGFYQFLNLLPGTYTVTFTRPDGYVYSPKNAGGPGGVAVDSNADVNTGTTEPVTLAAGEHNPTIDAGLYKPASLGDFVWDDVNANGVQDAGEPGVPGVTVTLTGPNGTSTTTTDATGKYLFDNLVPGSYTVTFAKPEGTAFTATGQGTPATDSNANTTTGQTGVINLASGESDLTIDAGLVKLGRIGDYVWKDNNGNGIQDAGEPGIPGVTVTLTGPNNLQKTTTTDATGYYIFEKLEPGEYTVVFTKPAGYTFTTPFAGAPDKDSNADVNTGASELITLAAGQSNLTIDAGLYQPASLGDFVWNDLNANGVQDMGEPGIANVTVTLNGPGGTKTTTTDATGKYLFTNLAPGSYTVTFAKPTGFVFTTANVGADDKDSDANSSGATTAVTLAGGEHNPTIDAGLYQLARLGDFVWKDLNGNGLQDAGEPGVAGVTVKVTGPNGYAATTTTDAAGYYEFKDLVPGTYTVTFVKPSGTVFTTANAGPDDKDDSDANATGATAAVNLAAGESNLTIDAGLYKLASLGDFVWEDVNKNGLQDAGEPGIGGVTVTLNGPGGTQTTTTNASGWYQFTNLVPGTYTVTFTKPTGYTFTTANAGADDKDSDANTTSGAAAPVTLASGQSNQTIDAGLIKPVVHPGYTTFTMGGWGTEPSGNNPGALLLENFTRLFPNGITIGGSRTLKFTSAVAVRNFLPQGGTPMQLTKSAINPTYKDNVFAGQLLAATLNVAFSNAGITKTGLSTNLTVQYGPLKGKTVAQVLTICNAVLGGAAPPAGVSVSDLNDTLAGINECFVDGIENTGYLK
jgi:protocatechuate 3,4-dioxygenase beta subunit